MQYAPGLDTNNCGFYSLCQHNVVSKINGDGLWLCFDVIIYYDFDKHVFL